MSTVLCKVEFARANALPEDVVVNSFVFQNGGMTPLELATGASAAVGEFYTTQFAGNANKITDFFPSTISRAAGAHHKKFYDITGKLALQLPDEDHPRPWLQPAGPPILDHAFTIDAPPAHDAMPAEVAAVITIHGDLAGHAESSPHGPVGPAGDIKPRARRRGRVYIGPLTTAAFQVDGNDARLRATFRDLLVDAMVALGSPDPLGLSVWSRKNGLCERVTGCWVDNAADIIRGRGSKATARTTAAI